MFQFRGGYACWSDFLVLVIFLFFYVTVNPLEFRGNHSATTNNIKLVHWPSMGGLLYLVHRGGDWVGQPAPLLSVPNITAHPSTASVGLPITVSLYNGSLLCGSLKG